MSQFVRGIWPSSRADVVPQVVCVTEKVANFVGKNRAVCAGFVSTAMQVFFLLLLGLCGFVALASKSKDELIFVQVVWRHGDRAPSSTFPRNPNTAKSWPLGFGQLTSQGMDQTVELGKVLRELYIDIEDPLISPYPVGGEYRIQSTEVDRTMASAAGVITGLFPKNDGRAARSFLAPVFATSLNTDADLNIFFNCPRAEELKAASFAKFTQLVNEHEWFFNLLENETGKRYNLSTIYEVHDNYLCDTYNNLKPAKWLVPSVLEVLDMLTAKQVDAILALPLDEDDFREFTRLRGGRILQTIVKNFAKRIKCDEDFEDKNCAKVRKLKFLGLSMHDVTIAHLMTALTRDLPSIVPGNLVYYTGSFSFELWKRNGKFSLRILYRKGPEGSTYKPVTNQISKLGSQFWDFEKFLTRVTPFMPTNFTNACQLKKAVNRGKRDYQPGPPLSEMRFPAWDVAMKTRELDDEE
uniref:acid phosphatase n=1 Tax=Panagrellus redivivus TaxID=6233 RepID=A0A7E4VR99_PANRE